MTTYRKAITLLIAVAVGAATVFFVTTAAKAFFLAPRDEQEMVGVPPREERGSSEISSGDPSWPTRLIIPEAGVDAPVIDVGLSSRGAMAVPRTYFETGWYRYGAIPGETGSAVFDGHVDNGLSLPAVFADIHRLDEGDAITVRLRDGAEMLFLVEEVRTYPVDQVPTDLIFNRADAARLNLITCSGRWIDKRGTYDERVVVFAKRAQ